MGDPPENGLWWFGRKKGKFIKFRFIRKHDDQVSTYTWFCLDLSCPYGVLSMFTYFWKVTTSGRSEMENGQNSNALIFWISALLPDVTFQNFDVNALLTSLTKVIRNGWKKKGSSFHIIEICSMLWNRFLLT